MTPEHIKACQQAKEEGWLVWKPAVGDWCLYETYPHLIIRIQPEGLILIRDNGMLLDGWALVDNCTWLPAEGQLSKMLQEACLRCSCCWEPGDFAERKRDSKAGKWWVSGFVDRKENYDIHVGDVDLPLALLKAVAVVRRKF